MIIYLYIFHENSLLTLEIICLISTLYIIIYLTSLHCFYYVVFNVGYRQYQSHAIINYLSNWLQTARLNSGTSVYTMAVQ